MNQAEQPLMSWGDDEEIGADDDFLSEVEGQDVPKACSLDNPDCEACQ